MKYETTGQIKLNRELDTLQSNPVKMSALKVKAPKN